MQEAQQLAFNNGNPNIETEHLLKALMEQEDSNVEYLLKKNNVTMNLVDAKLEERTHYVPAQLIQNFLSRSRQIQNAP